LYKPENFSFWPKARENVFLAHFFVIGPCQFSIFEFLIFYMYFILCDLPCGKLIQLQLSSAVCAQLDARRSGMPEAEVAKLGGHSLHSGTATTAAPIGDNGEREICALTGHRSREVRRYELQQHQGGTTTEARYPRVIGPQAGILPRNLTGGRIDVGEDAVDHGFPHHSHGQPFA
jgi:hypothetical protein